MTLMNGWTIDGGAARLAATSCNVEEREKEKEACLSMGGGEWNVGGESTAAEYSVCEEAAGRRNGKCEDGRREGIGMGWDGMEGKGVRVLNRAIA